MWKPPGTLRTKILSTVLGLVLICLFGSVLALLKVSSVQEELSSLPGAVLPGARTLEQLYRDFKIFESSQPPAPWMIEAIDRDFSRLHLIAEKLSRSDERWRKWAEWLTPNQALWEQIRQEREQVLSGTNLDPVVVQERQSHFLQTLAQGTGEFDRLLRSNLESNVRRVRDLRTGLEVILGVVILLSLFILWIGERALRPLSQLTRLAREITARGVRRQDKSVLAELVTPHADEVGTLAVEFRRMATALLERERQIEVQTARLKDSNRLLHEMGELNRNILGSIHSSIIVTDLELVVQAVNPSAEHGLGGGSGHWVGQPLLKLQGGVHDSTLLGELMARLQEPLRRILVGKGLSEAVGLGIQVVKGRVLSTRVLPLRDEIPKPAEGLPSGRPQGLVIWIEDLTEESALQERLSRAEKLEAIARMSAQVAHEIRNPLHSIGLEVELALEAAPPKNVEESLLSISKSVGRLDQITRNYLMLTRTSSGKKEAVDLVTILRDVLATYAPQCGESKIHVEIQGPPEAWIWADRRLMEQAIGNLMKNSIQAIEGQSVRSITWELMSLESGRWRLAVSDSGPGLTQDVIDHLFIPFVTTRAEGTGLGLSFVKQVIEAHEGSVQWVQNESAQSGARFEILLPGIEKDRKWSADTPWSKMSQERNDR